MTMAEFSELIPKTVLAVGAHADDIDFGASGTVAKFAAAGAAVHYLVVTDGSKGSADTTMTKQQLVAMRRREQRAAAASLGAKEVHFLDYEDAMLEVTMELKKDIVRLIRKVKPDTVMVMDPTMVYDPERGFINHPDHRAVGQATLDAVFPLARDHMTFPDLFLQEELPPHKVAHVLLINLTRQNYYVDITDSLETKLAALQCHASQVPDEAQLRAWLTERATAMGQRAGCRYAEGFMRLDVPA